MPLIAVGDGMGDYSSNLYRFTYSGGVINDIVHIAETGHVMLDVAINPAEGPWSRVFAIADTGVLYTVDLTSGVTTYVGNTGLLLSALEFCNGTLYGWGQGTFVSINPSTGQATVLSHPTWSASGDLMCSPTGVLWGIARSSTGNDKLVTFTSTGDNVTVGIDLPGTNFYGGIIDGMGAIYVARKTGTSTATLYYVAQSGLIAVGSFTNSWGLYGLTSYPAVW